MEMRDEMLSSVGAQNVDRSGYQVSDLDNVEFHWENDQLDVDAVFTPGIDKSFSPSIFNAFELGSINDNHNPIDKAQDKENSVRPHPTILVSDGPAQPPVLKKSCDFGTKIKNVPDYVYRSLMEKFVILLCMFFNVHYI